MGSDEIELEMGKPTSNMSFTKSLDVLLYGVLMLLKRSLWRESSIEAANWNTLRVTKGGVRIYEEIELSDFKLVSLVVASPRSPF